MTDAMNLIQSIFTNPYFSSGNLNRGEIKLAHGLTREAQESASKAEDEARNGLAAQKLAADSGTTAAGQDLRAIALWHFERALKLYRDAIDWFEQANRVWPQAKRRKLIRSEINKITERAMTTESSIAMLTNNSFKQN